MSKDDYLITGATPKQVRREIRRWYTTAWFLIASVFALIIGLVVAGHEFGWWLANENAQHTAHIVQGNYNVQEGYVTRINSDVAAIDANIALGGSGTGGTLAQNIHSGDDACQYANLLVPGEITIAPTMQKWIDTNCLAGALNSTSNVYKGGNGE